MFRNTVSPATQPRLPPACMSSAVLELGAGLLDVWLAPSVTCMSPEAVTTASSSPLLQPACVSPSRASARPALRPPTPAPILQVCIAALLLIALTFYSGLTLSDHTYGTNETRPAAIAILCVLTIPFASFLWWLTLGRICADRVSWARGGAPVGHFLGAPSSLPAARPACQAARTSSHPFPPTLPLTPCRHINAETQRRTARGRAVVSPS